MDKRTITLLVVAISIALMGLVLIQLRWVSDTMRLQDDQFNDNVDNALLAVSDRLERADALQSLRVDTPDPQLTLGGHAAAPSAPLDSTATPKTDGPLYELLNSILSSRMFQDIHERIDPRLLDSLITEELSIRHIRGRHEHGVFTAQGEAVLLHLAELRDSIVVAESPHRVLLFRNDRPEGGIGVTPYWLHVHVPEQRAMLLQDLWPMLAISGLLILVLALAFGFTLWAIRRQKRLGDIKNDLVNNLTHELKTPISTIALACEALNDPGMPRDPAQVKHFTTMIKDENKRLGMLVESVLQNAVLDSGKMQLRTMDVDMHALLAEVVRNSALQAENRGGSIILIAKAELAHVRGDRTHLTNIFYNLIDNAVKYCTSAPIIRITTRSDARALTIEVQDNGIGIPRSEHDKVFDRLYRVPTGNVHNVKGFGLGLSYVKAVMERHGGTIRVESDPEGFQPITGSLFIITIPFEHGEPDQAPLVRGRRQPR